MFDLIICKLLHHERLNASISLFPGGLWNNSSLSTNKLITITLANKLKYKYRLHFNSSIYTRTDRKISNTSVFDYFQVFYLCLAEAIYEATYSQINLFTKLSQCGRSLLPEISNLVPSSIWYELFQSLRTIHPDVLHSIKRWHWKARDRSFLTIPSTRETENQKNNWHSYFPHTTFCHIFF